jgi:hypothetical protein
MKKLCLLSGMMVFGFVANINADLIYPGGITYEQAQNIEQVQRGKIERQRELARPSIYKMIDALIKEEDRQGHVDENGQWIEDTPEKVVVDWPAVFAVIDSMHGTIDVNEYDTPLFGDFLIWVAVEQGNFLAVKTLLEKYNANPNVSGCSVKHPEGEVCPRKSLLAVARKDRDLAIVLLLRQHGAVE